MPDSRASGSPVLGGQPVGGQGIGDQGNGDQGVRGQRAGGQPPARPRRHDPRIDPPTKADRRRLGWWLAVLAFTPVCLGVLVWATVSWNGSYPTVNPLVPRGWQAVPGIYASFSVPGNWSLQPFMSDAAADVYYSGPTGGAGESVTQADRAPSPTAPLPPIVGTFLGDRYSVSSLTPFKLHNATVAWRYRFRLANGTNAIGVLAWVGATQSEVWLIASPISATTDKALSTLTLAS